MTRTGILNSWLITTRAVPVPGILPADLVTGTTTGRYNWISTDYSTSTVVPVLAYKSCVDGFMTVIVCTPHQVQVLYGQDDILASSGNASEAQVQVLVQVLDIPSFPLDSSPISHGSSFPSAFLFVSLSQKGDSELNSTKSKPCAALAS